MKKTIVDIFYNTLYQILIVFLPFITIPYLSRVLGPNLIGINGLITSITQFLGILTLAGLNQYGVRKIRQVSLNTKKELSDEFISLFFYQILLGIISLFIYTCVISLQEQNHLFYIASVPLLISSMLDISWFFQGIERIRQVVLRNTVIKVGTLILIFLFVKGQDDFYIYLIIMSVGTLLGNIILWIPLRKLVYFKIPNKTFIKNNKKTLYLLVPQIAIQIYITLDITFLGIFSNNLDVAFYSQSQRLIRISTAIISSISLVMMPRMVAALSQNENVNSLLKKSYEFTFFFAGIISVVLFCESENFVPWFFGSEYYPMILLLKALSVLIILVSVGGVFSNQFAIALEKDKFYARPLILGAILSLMMNIFLIPLMGAWGATITSITVEASVCIYRIFIVRNYYDKNVLINTKKYIFAIFIAVVIGRYVDVAFFNSVLLKLILESTIIVVLYTIIIIILDTEIKKTLIKVLEKRKK